MPKKTAQLIDGKALAERILLELKGKISRLKEPPGLAAILIGDDPSSKLYIENKKKACHKIGIQFSEYLCGKKCFPNITELEVLKMIDFLNNDKQINGIVVQLPLPNKFSVKKIISRISPKKDVDGFHPESQKNPLLIPPLIQAINIALESTKENLKNKTAVIVSKNPIFSQPLEKNLEKKGLKIKAIRPETGFEKQVKAADILIVIVGQKYLIKKSMVKPGAIVIDVGTNLIGPKKWVGDVDPAVAEVASYLTPVPGGIGPLTVACLLKNTYGLAKKQQG